MILLISSFISMIDRSVMPPLVPVIADDFGVPIDAVGHSLTAYAVAYAAFQLFWSTLAARFGRVRVLLTSTAIAGAANAATALATTPLTYNVTRSVAAAAFSATITTVLIYYGDTLTLKQRAVATANLAAAISLGLAAGTLGAGMIAQWWGWRWVYALVAAACLLLMFGLARVPESATATRESLLTSVRRLAVNPWAVGILFFTVIEGALLIGVFNYLPVALQTQGATVLMAGLVTSAFGAAVVVATQLMKLVLDHWPPWLLLLLAGLAIIGAYATLTVEVSLTTVLAGTSLMGLAWALGHTTLQTWMTDAATEGRAIGMSLFSVALFVGASIGAAAGNVAAGAHRFTMLFALATAVAAGYAAATTAARGRYVVREQPPDGR